MLADVRDLTPEVYDTARDNAYRMVARGGAVEEPQDQTAQLEENMKRLKAQFPDREKSNLADVLRGAHG